MINQTIIKISGRLFTCKIVYTINSVNINLIPGKMKMAMKMASKNFTADENEILSAFPFLKTLQWDGAALLSPDNLTAKNLIEKRLKVAPLFWENKENIAFHFNIQQNCS